MVCAAGMPKMASETLMVALKFVFLGPISPLSGQLRWAPKDCPGFIGGRTPRPTVSPSTSSKPLNPLGACWCLNALNWTLSSKIPQFVLPSIDHSLFLAKFGFFSFVLLGARLRGLPR